ncbi:DNA modification methylase [Mesorhizobium loti]|uniref:Methyltransferase n=2 Tax=Rhizobium loti TaxID=381 RepID=A0A8E3B5I1_RHILI|nr:DNA modification methylase [Mesorhizobium loti]
MSGSITSMEMMDVTALRPYARNARVHSRQQIAKIAHSITEYGFTNPPLIDENGEIIAGHGRVAAAKQLRLQIVPVIRILGLSDVQKRALRLADNKLALDSVWSVELLAEELKGLITTDFDLTLTGFDGIEIDRLVTPSLSVADQDDEVPAPPNDPVTQDGDVWALGSHRIVCGDAREAASYSAVLRGELAQAVVADVPYNTPIAGNVSGKGSVKHPDFQMASGEMSRKEFREFLCKALSLACLHSRDGSLHYVFSDWRMIGLLIGIGEEAYSKLLNIIAWVKPNAGLGSHYRSQHELIAVFKHGEAAHINNVQLGRMGRYRSNVWQYAGASGFSKTRKRDLKDHPTVKPLMMIADAIRDATNPGDVVLDPFGGSGTTLIAAELTGRRACLIEIEPKFVDVTMRRFRERTGVEPKLLPDMTPLSVVHQQRESQKEA